MARVLSIKKPSREREAKQVRSAAAKLGRGEKRIVADVPENIHRHMRARCFERGILVQDYIVELLRKDGVDGSLE